jgi:hypothetical protein
MIPNVSRGLSVLQYRVRHALVVAIAGLAPSCKSSGASSRTVTVTPAAQAAPAVAPEIPTRLSDSTFWRLISDLSEPGGFFRSDNFVSNETSFQYVIPELERTIRPGGVYLGVAPDQNFTYLVALRPRIAFIVDIRRQNMIHHLMYKAMIEMAPDRAGFMSLLFARPRPNG